MGVMPLTALREASAPETADTGATARDSVAAICRRKSNSASTANFPPLNTTGAASRSAPTARCFKLTTGSRRGGSIRRERGSALSRRLSWAVSPTARSHSCCRFASKKNTGCAGCAGLARTCATTTRRCWRAIFAARRARSLPRHLADFASANAKRSATAPRLDRLCQNAEAGRRSNKSLRLSRGHDQCERRASRAPDRKLGDVTSPSARLRRAGAIAASALTSPNTATFVSSPRRIPTTRGARSRR